MKNKKVLISSAINKYDGQLFTFDFRKKTTDDNNIFNIYYTDNVYSKFASEKLCSYHKSPCIQNRSILDQFNVKKVNGYLILKLIKN